MSWQSCNFWNGDLKNPICHLKCQMMNAPICDGDDCLFQKNFKLE